MLAVDGSLAPTNLSPNRDRCRTILKTSWLCRRISSRWATNSSRSTGLVQALVVERRHPGLARAGRATTRFRKCPRWRSAAYRFQHLQLERFRGHVDADASLPASSVDRFPVCCRAPPGGERRRPRVVRLELRLIPVLLERCGDALDDRRVSTCVARTFHSRPSTRAEWVRFEEPT